MLLTPHLLTFKSIHLFFVEQKLYLDCWILVAIHSGKQVMRKSMNSDLQHFSKCFFFFLRLAMLQITCFYAYFGLSDKKDA